MKFRDKITEGHYYTEILIILMGIFLFAASCKAQSKEEVYKYCDSIGIQHVDIVVNQSLLETGQYQCKDCSLDQNNIFGFRWKKQYIKFDTWQESCDYYKRWQDKRYKGQPNYYDFLKCVRKHSNGDCMPYATSKQYIQKLKQF